MGIETSAGAHFFIISSSYHPITLSSYPLDKIRLIVTITCGVDGSRGWGLRLALVPTEDNEAKLPSLPGNITKDNVIKDCVITDNIIKDNVIKDCVITDNIIKDNLIKDNEAKLPSLPSKDIFIKDNVDNEMLSRIMKPSFLLCLQIFELLMLSRKMLSRMVLSRECYQG